MKVVSRWLESRRAARRCAEEFLNVRRLAARLWVKDGGYMPLRNGGLLHQFMIQHPDTRKHYERIARNRLSVAGE